ASSGIGRLSVKNFTQRTNPGDAQGFVESAEQTAGPCTICIDSSPRLLEVANQPGPDRPLMVSRVPGAQVTIVAGFVVWVPRNEGTQPNRCQELCRDRRKHRRPEPLG